MATTKSAIATSEFQARRDRVLKELKGSAAVIFAGEGNPPLLGKWTADANFVYLTGITSEPGAAVLFDPSAEHPDRRITLLLRPTNPEIERWDGYREQIGSALRRATGFGHVMRASYLPGLLTAAATRTKSLACLHPFSTYPSEVSADFKIFKEISNRVSGVTIVDQTRLLPTMRCVKSPAELEQINSAITATVAGYRAAMKFIQPGVNERDISDLMEFEYRKHGCGLAYNNIVGAGFNGTVLHYNANNQTVGPSDLIVIDSGASSNGYAADITRTFPSNGKFTSDQREVYEVVLQAQLAGIKASRVGATFTDIDRASRDVIEKAGFGDAFIHGIGHNIGLQVHDVTPPGAIKAGQVITIEPGIYLPDRKLGVRIEDDILITRTGPKVLTAAVPKTVKDVESAMQ